VWVLLLIAVGSTLNGMGNGFTAIILTSAIQKKANRNVAKVLAFIGNTENIVGVMVTIVAGVVMENFHHIQLMLLISSPIFLLSLIFVGFMDLKS
jgi:copper homeostasis protein CutC